MSWVEVNDREALETTRRKTPEGFLRAKASLTKSGVFKYKASELGLAGGDTVVRVNRPEESVHNSETYDSLRGLPITIDHPDRLTPDNFRGLVIGSVVGEPERGGSGYIESDVIICDASGIDAVEERGLSELSIGYAFDIQPAESGNMLYDYETVGPLSVNHVALVQRGRAGRNIRIHDSDGGSMTDIDAQALRDALKDIEAEDKAAEDRDSDLVTRVSDAVIDKIGETKSIPDGSFDISAVDSDSLKDAIKATLKDEIAEAAKSMADEMLADARAKDALIADASPFLSEDQRENIEAKDAKQILVEAVGDSVENASEQTEDYLRGALQMMAKARAADDSYKTWRADTKANVGGFDSLDMTARDVKDVKKSDAYAKYVEELQNAWQTGDSIEGG